MVLYYSRTKKTKVFAEALGEVLGREVYELESELNNIGMFKFMFKSLGMAFSGKSYPVSNMPRNIPGEVYLCAPVWGGQVVGPPKYFLENADLSKTTVNMLLTASTPIEKYKKNVSEMLNKFTCKQGEIYLFATADKVMPEKDVIKEQLQEILN